MTAQKITAVVFRLTWRKISPKKNIADRITDSMEQVYFYYKSIMAGKFGC